eukprot:SAG31_NODE_4278_length_3384_cov_1.471537_4_plen_116_part_00
MAARSGRAVGTVHPGAADVSDSSLCAVAHSRLRVRARMHRSFAVVRAQEPAGAVGVQKGAAVGGLRWPQALCVLARTAATQRFTSEAKRLNASGSTGTSGREVGSAPLVRERAWL